MISYIITRLVALACILAVCSLPISATKLGSSLRRWAAFCFIAALAPSVFVGIAREVVPADFGSNPVLAFIASLVVLAAISIIAYIALSLRRGRQRPSQERVAMKHPFTPRRGEDDLFAFLRNQLDRDQVERDDG